MLLAPRRVGKTSLAYRVGEEATKAGWKFAMVDVQGDREEVSLLDNLLRNLKAAGIKVPVMAHLTEAVSMLRRNVKLGGGGFGIHLEAKENEEATTLEHLVERLFLEIEKEEDKILIAVDELPVFLTELERIAEGGEDRLRGFLNWFRAVRIRYSKNVRWLMLGSVGLDTFTETRRLNPSVNDLATESLGAYTDETAVDFLKGLASSKGFEIPNDVCHTILAEIGWPLPFFLQLVFQRLHENLGRPPRTPTQQDAKAACRQLVQPEYYKHFETWRGRLVEGLSAEALKAAMAVLNALCAQPEGLPRAVLLDALTRKFPQRDGDENSRLLSTVLGQLERDGYILRKDGAGDEAARYAFRSFLLRKYWHAREVA